MGGEHAQEDRAEGPAGVLGGRAVSLRGDELVAEGVQGHGTGGHAAVRPSSGRARLAVRAPVRLRDSTIGRFALLQLPQHRQPVLPHECSDPQEEAEEAHEGATEGAPGAEEGEEAPAKAAGPAVTAAAAASGQAQEELVLPGRALRGAADSPEDQAPALRLFLTRGTVEEAQGRGARATRAEEGEAGRDPREPWRHLWPALFAQEQPVADHAQGQAGQRLWQAVQHASVVACRGRRHHELAGDLRP
mmetsp:Transcript_16739/g.65388  ORF Transcript_16739/g.65388 Transcript_16739/m.65388 type:complete len:247 (-) Transcript_16739:1282-2022(-)